MRAVGWWFTLTLIALGVTVGGALSENVAATLGGLVGTWVFAGRVHAGLRKM